MASPSSGRCPGDLFASLLPEHVRGHFAQSSGPEVDHVFGEGSVPTQSSFPSGLATTTQ
jgi:hypothetical protein